MTGAGGQKRPRLQPVANDRGETWVDAVREHGRRIGSTGAMIATAVFHAECLERRGNSKAIAVARANKVLDAWTEDRRAIAAATVRKLITKNGEPKR